MNSFLSLLLCLIVGLFSLIGTFIALKVKNKDALLDFSIALAISVLITLAFLDILPECYELISNKLSINYTFITIFVGALGGIIILTLLDKLVPHHDSGHEQKNHVLEHIAIITTLAIGIHNLIEGMALYSAFLITFKTGLIFSIGIACHNVALGLTITTELQESTKSMKQIIGFMVLLGIATLIGGIIMMLFNIMVESNLFLGIIMSITLGMIVYLVFFELFSLFLKSKNKKISMIGIVCGIIIMLLTSLI